MAGPDLDRCFREAFKLCEELKGYLRNGDFGSFEKGCERFFQVMSSIKEDITGQTELSGRYKNKLEGLSKEVGKIVILMLKLREDLSGRLQGIEKADKVLASYAKKLVSPGRFMNFKA